ncbi:MAG: acyloxyacyl hydrolase [Verrucomicrobiota bacterium]
MKSTFGLIILSALILFATQIRAQQVASEPSNPDYRTAAQTRDLVKDPLFQRNRITLQLTAGALASHVGIGPETDTFNYTMTNLRLGWMLNTPAMSSHPLDGNVEFIFELSASGIFEGAGNYLVGPTALIRYNFVQPNWVVTPYIQVGAGLTFTDASDDQSQRAIGQELEFTPQASIGLKYQVADNWTFDGEFIYHHISNAGLSDRNLGINALGGMIGFTYYFDRLWD